MRRLLRKNAGQPVQPPEVGKTISESSLGESLVDLAMPMNRSSAVVVNLVDHQVYVEHDTHANILRRYLDLDYFDTDDEFAFGYLIDDLFDRPAVILYAGIGAQDPETVELLQAQLPNTYVFVEYLTSKPYLLRLAKHVTRQAYEQVLEEDEEDGSQVGDIIPFGKDPRYEGYSTDDLVSPNLRDKPLIVDTANGHLYLGHYGQTHGSLVMDITEGQQVDPEEYTYENALCFGYYFDNYLGRPTVILDPFGPYEQAAEIIKEELPEVAVFVVLNEEELERIAQSGELT